MHGIMGCNSSLTRSRASDSNLASITIYILRVVAVELNVLLDRARVSSNASRNRTSHSDYDIDIFHLPSPILPPHNCTPRIQTRIMDHRSVFWSRAMTPASLDSMDAMGTRPQHATRCRESPTGARFSPLSRLDEERGWGAMTSHGRPSSYTPDLARHPPHRTRNTLRRFILTIQPPTTTTQVLKQLPINYHYHYRYQ